MPTKWMNHAVSRLAPVFCLAVAAGALSGCSGDSVSSSISGFIRHLQPPSPMAAAREAFNMYDADKRREGVALLSASSFGGKEPYVRMYRLLLTDPDPTVRGACAKALGEHGDVADAKRLQPLLEDHDAFVRWETAKALERIHNPVVVPQLMDRLKNDDDADVRIACARALGQYPQPRVFDVLVGALADPDYGVVASAAWSLKTLTGNTTLGDDGAAWIRWRQKHVNDLFAREQVYTYQPYDPPPGFIREMKFWKPITPPAPREPVGLRAPASQPVSR